MHKNDTFSGSLRKIRKDGRAAVLFSCALQRQTLGVPPFAFVVWNEPQTWGRIGE